MLMPGSLSTIRMPSVSRFVQILLFSRRTPKAHNVSRWKLKSYISRGGAKIAKIDCITALSYGHFVHRIGLMAQKKTYVIRVGLDRRMRTHDSASAVGTGA